VSDRVFSDVMLSLCLLNLVGIGVLLVVAFRR
jgi:hypothetical protein